MEDLILYAVRNQGGAWFRRKGYGGGGDTWAVDFKSARIYNKIGPARAIISFFANNYPNYSPPSLVALKVSAIEVVDEKDRVAAQKIKKEIAKKKREAEGKKYAMESAKRRYEDAKKELDKLTSK